MDPSFTARLRCPGCGGSFEAETFREDEHGIEEGALTCAKCGRVVPIIAGVPRVLPAYLNRHLATRFPDYFREHAVTIQLSSSREPIDQLNLSIFNAFHYNLVARPSVLRRVSKAASSPGDAGPLSAWDRRVFFDNVAPHDASFFTGKFGLEAGCNIGKYVMAANENGAEMVGLEQSFAIDRARELTRGKRGIHLVQGSLFEFPLQENLFDFALCLGVLHHTPDAQGAFRIVAGSVKPGGVFITMLYGIDEMPYWYRVSHMRSFRAVTTRIPLSATRKVCELLAVTMKYALIPAVSAVSRIPGIGPAAERFPFFHLRKHNVVEISRSFFDRLAPPVTTYHKRSEIAEWYRASGFSNVVVSRREVNAWRGYGLRKA